MNSNLLLILLFILLLFIVYQYLNVRERFTGDSLLSSLDNLKQRASEIEFPSLSSTDNIENIARDLLIDQEELESEIFQRYQGEQNTRIANLENKLSDLEKHHGHIKKPQAHLRSIKSLNNGLKMSVIPLSDNRHLVRVNDGCLSCDSVGNYDIRACDANNPQQHFELHEIHNKSYYNLNLEPGVPKIKNGQNGQNGQNGNIKYPFYMTKSVTSGNCVQNNHNKLSVQPCNVKTSQRWLGFNKNNICS